MTRRPAALLALTLLSAAPAAAAPDAADPTDISAVALEDLLDLPVAAASLRTERTREAPASVFVLTAEDFRALGARTLQEALAAVPGLFAYRDDLFPQVGVRGVGLLGDYTTRLLVLVDGHPMNNAVGLSQSYLDRDLPVPFDLVRRIEVVKGPAGGVYGPTAFLGVVNVVTAEPGPAPLELTAYGEGAQGEARGGGVAAAAGGALGGLRVAVGAEGYGTRGVDWTFPELVGAPERPAPPGGRVQGMGSAGAGAAYLRLALGDWRLAAACGGHAHGIPSAPYLANLLDDRNRVSARTCFADLGATWQVAPAASVAARLAYDDFEVRDAFVYDPPPADVGVARDLGTDRWVSGEVRVTAALDDRSTLVGGLRGEWHRTHQETWADGAPTLLVDPVGGVGIGPICKDYGTAGAYLVVDRRLTGWLAAQGAVTAHWDQLFGERLTPRLAAVLTPGDRDVLKAIWAQGFRAPTASDAFYEDGMAFLANPALRPETADAFELTWEHRPSERIALTLSAFATGYRRLITFVPVPDPVDPAAERLQAQNAEAFWVTGGELTVNARPDASLRVLGGLSAQRASSGRANFPGVTGNLLVRWRTPWRPLSLAAAGTFTGRREKPDGAGRVEAQGLLTARAVLEVPWVPGLDLELGVTNLLDAAAPAPTTNEYLPLTELPSAPRTVGLLARWRGR